MSTPTVSRLSGTGYNQIKLPTKSPEQMDIFSQLSSGSGGNIQSILKQLQGLSDGGDEDYWSQLEAPALRQFDKRQGDIASRFSGMGMGGRRSGAFQTAVGNENTDLQERLSAQRLGIQGNARNQLMELYRSLLGENLSDSGLTPKPQSFLKQLGIGLSGGVGQGIGTAAGALAFG